METWLECVTIDEIMALLVLSGNPLDWLCVTITSWYMFCTHEHYYTTYDPRMCQNAQCSCGAGISLEEAAATDTPVYWREQGRLVQFSEDYIRDMKEKFKNAATADSK